MKHIRYYHPASEQFFFAVLVHENSHAFYVVEPLLYEWLVKSGNGRHLPLVPSLERQKSVFTYTSLAIPQTSLSETPWVMRFPFDVVPVEDWHKCACYLEWYLSMKGAQSVRLEETKRRTAQGMESHLLSLMDRFVRENEEEA